MLERTYQAQLIRRMQRRFPGAVVLKNDTGYLQGVPDLLVLNGDRWAMLEVKASEDADIQPNQDYYVNLFDDMSFGAFIYPENEEDILYEVQRSFQTRRTTRLSQRQ